jgi:hypothetical protein
VADAEESAVTAPAAGPPGGYNCQGASRQRSARGRPPRRMPASGPALRCCPPRFHSLWRLWRCLRKSLGRFGRIQRTGIAGFQLGDAERLIWILGYLDYEPLTTMQALRFVPPQMADQGRRPVRIEDKESSSPSLPGRLSSKGNTMVIEDNEEVTLTDLVRLRLTWLRLPTHAVFAWQEERVSQGSGEERVCTTA